MTEAELLDKLAMEIDSPRNRGQLKRIRKAFADYTMYKKKRKWWVAMRTLNNKWQFWKKEAL